MRRLPHARWHGRADYIHVVDLAQGHLAALRYLDAHEGRAHGEPGNRPRVQRCWKWCAHSSAPPAVRFRCGWWRAGPATSRPCYADPSLAAKLLGWRAQRDADAMCRDAWRWQQWRVANPQAC